ncbi:hypothetical protein HYW21_05870 [Candidatus Woesearchaeota archaeon]|nr:hypothetical protein [Candidatus Woesearchaeota archaeon]
MGLFDRFKRSSASKEEFYLKEDPVPQIKYEIKDGIIHFQSLNLINVLGVDLRLNKTRYRLCNWEGFHIFVMGFISGWGSIQGMIQFSDSLKKGKIPDMLKVVNEKELNEIKNYTPPENFFAIKEKLENMSEPDVQKIKKIKEILGDDKLLCSYAADHLIFIVEFIMHHKKIQRSKDKPVAEIESLIYKKPFFSVDLNNKMELRLVRFFILRDKITPEDAKLMLPVVKNILYGTILNQPGIKIPKETIQLEIKYFKRYINILERSIQDNATIEPLFLE